MFKRTFLVFLSFAIIGITLSCNSPTTSQPELIEYKSEALVQYTRPEVVCPDCGGDYYRPGLVAYLADPNVDGGIRKVVIDKMERAEPETDDQGREVFEAYIYHVFKQTAEHSKKHEFWVQDQKLWNGVTDSNLTGKIIHVEGEYDREVYDNLMKCRIK